MIRRERKPALERQIMKYITIKQFCDRFQCSRSHFYRIAKRDHISIVKLGRASRIALDQAEAWAASLPMMGR
jgi:excisionase family DNA binding protein